MGGSYSCSECDNKATIRYCFIVSNTEEGTDKYGGTTIYHSSGYNKHTMFRCDNHAINVKDYDYPCIETKYDGFMYI
jgi:hypothetical protein